MMTEQEKQQNWSNFINKFFPEGVPEKIIWNDVRTIAKKLNEIGFEQSGAYNHTFFPGGGGLDLLSADVSEYERGCIEVNFDGTLHVMKPTRLIFHSFEADPEWFYFRLEVGGLKPSEVYEELSEPYEEVCRLPDGTYIDRSYFDHGYYGYDERGNEIRLPKGSRVVCRHLEGAFVTFGKFSKYNRNSSTYDGRHNKMNDEQFRNHIQLAIDYIKDRQNG